MAIAVRLGATLVLLLQMAIASPVAADGTGAEADPRRGRRVEPRETFDRVWVVERSTPELYPLLTRLVSGGGFRPIVLASGEGMGSRARELNHLLESLPSGSSQWVGGGPVPVGLNVDRVVRPWQVLTLADGADRVVYCPEPALVPFAALAAMRLDGVLMDTPPSSSAELVVQFGGEPLAPTQVKTADYRFVTGTEEALDLVNSLAERAAVMVVRAGSLLPEYVLYAFQRGALLAEVTPPPYSSYDAESEIVATMATRDQILAQLVRLGFDADAIPEALVIAGDWAEIPYRSARSLEDTCPGCDNGVFEYSADVEYANLDGDPWGEPEIPVGRLMSYDRDLLSLQTVVGVWKDQGAFPPAPRAAFLDILAADWRTEALDRWRDAVPDRDWEIFGPDGMDPDFELDREDFFAFADTADLVLVRAHGTPNSLATLHRTQLNGAAIAATAADATPAFWLVDGCATARYLDPDRPHGLASRDGNNNLLSAIQSRLAFGALLSVEIVGQASGSIWWPTVAAERGIPIGELVRRGMAAAVAAYRGDDGMADFPDGPFPRPVGTASDLTNARTAMLWIGDPLTVFE